MNMPKSGKNLFLGGNMKVIYPVIFTETENGVLVYIPSLDGMTEGATLADAVDMARDYIANSLFDKNEKEFPAQSETADIEKSPFFTAGKTFVSLVDVDIDFFRMKEKSRNVRRNITLPEWLDNMAAEAHLNVSEITREALKTVLCV